MPPESHLLDPLREGPTSGTGLLRTLQLPQPRLARALQVLQREGEVVQAGSARRPHYALPRKVPGAGTRWPVFQVDPAGNLREFGRLTALMPRHFQFESATAPAILSEGLPWFLRGIVRPGAGAMSTDASGDDDACLRWRVNEGWDAAGDLLVGATALDAWRADLARRTPLRADERAVHYPRLVAAALQDPFQAATAADQQPGFGVLLDHGGHQARAQVKFSPPLDTAEGQRRADLLICEHLALGYLNARGVGAAHSRVYRFEGRIYLEIDRFDRVGAEGRRGLVSIGAALASRGGEFQGWSQASRYLAGAGALPRNDARQVRLVEAFAALIGNRRRGAEDLALFDRHDGSFALAPVQDMWPMHFASADIRTPQPYAPVPPIAGLHEVWPHARRLAEGYWERLAGEGQLSPGMRALCAQSLAGMRGGAAG